MPDDPASIRWSPKVEPARIKQLYEMEADGLYDEEWIDDVGYALYARCQSILDVTAAVQGRARCFGCGGVIHHRSDAASVLTCPDCGWSVAWKTYQKSYQEKQLFGGAAIDLFRHYAERFPGASTTREKLLLIDRLLHEFHWYQTGPDDPPNPARPTAANLIKGRSLREVVAFLDGLTYGEGSHAETLRNRDRWRRNRKG